MLDVKVVSKNIGQEALTKSERDLISLGTCSPSTSIGNVSCVGGVPIGGGEHSWVESETGGVMVALAGVCGMKSKMASLVELVERELGSWVTITFLKR